MNVDEIGNCYYYATGAYKAIEYMQDGVVYNNGGTGGYTTFTNRNRPSWMTTFKDHNDLWYNNAGQFYINVGSWS